MRDAEEELALAEQVLTARDFASSRAQSRLTLPKKKRMAISKASREVTSESGPPWHLWTKVRGAPGDLGEGLLDQAVAAVVVRARTRQRARRARLARTRPPLRRCGSWCRRPSAAAPAESGRRNFEYETGFVASFWKSGLKCFSLVRLRRLPIQSLISWKRDALVRRAEGHNLVDVLHRLAFRVASLYWPAPGSEDTELGVLWSRRCVMERRQFTREFKLEAVRLIKDRGVSYAKAAEDLGIHPTQLRSWVKQLANDPQHAFPGHGQMKPEQLEIAQLKREVAKLKAERDILKKAAAYFAKEST